MQKLCWFVFFPCHVLRDGFMKADQTKVGVMFLAVSMNFDFFPCLYYK